MIQITALEKAYCAVVIAITNCDGGLRRLSHRSVTRRCFFYSCLIFGFLATSISTTHADFTNVTSSAGLGNLDGEYGVAWGDYNNDGFIDFYITGADRLYRNNGNGTFSSGPSIAGDDRGVHWGDIDNDGDIDIGTTWELYLCRNNGDGSFTQLSNSAVGFTSINNLGDFAWLDYNKDGNLDLWAPNGSSPYTYMYAGYGNGTFAGVRGSTIGLTANTNGEATVVADFDNDGDIDILYRGSSVFLFRNNGDGTFTDVTSSTGVSLSGYDDGYNGTAFGDYDNDGDLDLYGGQNGANKLYRNNGNGTFTDVTTTAGVAGNSKDTKGVAWGDYDNDGDVDLYVAQRAGSNHLFRNNGDGTFTDVAASEGVADGSTSESRGVAWEDFDNDGDLDLLLASDGSDSKLYRNDLNNSDYLRIRVVGAGSGGTNTAGIGVRVDVYDQAGTSFIASRTIGNAMGYGSSEPLWAHFGGLNASTIYTVRAYVHSRPLSNPLTVQLRPSDVTTTIGATAISQMYTFVEPIVAADVPYAIDFESSIGEEWSGLTTATDYDADFTTFLGRFSSVGGPFAQLRVNTTVGETYTLTFDLYAIDSWAGDNTSHGPDTLLVAVNGVTKFSETFSQRPDDFPASYENPWDEMGQLGFENGSVDKDGIYRNVTVSFVATSSVSIIAFSETLDEGVNDESAGIDNVSVTTARFVDVSTVRGFDIITSSDSTYASGLHWFDADGDGDLDAILGGNQSERMLNGGSTFASSNFGTGNERRQHALFDVDNDGDVDFWSGNHSSYYEEACYRNDGSGGFSDIGNLGFSNPNNNEGVAAADVNRDGWCDIVHFCENDNWIGHHQGDPGASLPSLVGTNDDSYGLSDSGDIGNGDYASAGDVNNDGFLDFFYHYSGGKLFLSNGDGTYTENVRGITVTTGNSDKFGSAWADYDNDGDLDLFAARWDANNTGYLWRNDVSWGDTPSGSFSNQTANAAINDESGQFGCAWGDYDNDGDLDLYVATRSGPNKLYQNQGNGTFRMVDEGAGVTGNCQDVVFVDYDNDGDLDIAVTREDDTAVLLENRTNNDNYLKVRVVGAGTGATNTAAIGVRVELWNKQGTQLLGRRELGVARGLGTEPLWAHFGGIDPAETYQVWTYLHSRDNSSPLVTTVVPQSVSTTIGSITIPQMLTITEGDAKKRIKTWREIVNRS